MKSALFLSLFLQNEKQIFFPEYIILPLFFLLTFHKVIRLFVFLYVYCSLYFCGEIQTIINADQIHELFGVNQKIMNPLSFSRFFDLSLSPSKWTLSLDSSCPKQSLPHCLLLFTRSSQISLSQTYLGSNATLPS